MGNQGTTNWKLTAFFVIGLMLIAGMFSNAAMAAADDGTGTVAVEWGVSGTAQGALGTAALPATSAEAVLEFVYSQADDTNMEGGQLQIAIPVSWNVTKKSITVTDGNLPADATPTTAFNDRIIYLTNADGIVVEKNDDATTDNSRDAGRVMLTMSGDKVVRIRVNLTGWGYTADASDPAGDGTIARTLTILLGNVTAPARADTYYFQTSSKALDGRFMRLAQRDPDDTGPLTTQYTDNVTVGNVASGRGSIAITNTRTGAALSSVFAGDTARITFKFTATGSMNLYGADPGTPSTITITLPTGFPVPTDPYATTNDLASGMVSVLGKSGGVVFADVVDGTDGVQPLGITGQAITISISAMEAGQSVSIAYQADIASGTAAVATGFDVGTNTDGTAANLDTAAGSLDADVLDDDLQIRAKDGSGKLEIKPVSVKQGFKDQKFEIIYTAETEVRDASDNSLVPTHLRIQAPSEFSTSVAAATITGVPTPSSSAAYDSANNEITWSNLSIESGKSFRTIISKVNLNTANAEDVGTLTWRWTTTIAADNTGLPAAALAADTSNEVSSYIVKSADNDVTLDIIDANGVSVLSPTYNANSIQEITFRFRAVNTPISNGSVGLTIPGDWDTFTKGTAATDTGKVSGPAAADITLSGGNRTIEVKVKSLAQNATIDIKYANATMPADATDRTGEDRIRGFFVVSKDTLATKRNTEAIDVEIANVDDGSGTATIGAPSSTDVRAGSKDNHIRVQYTATGTMAGGAVRLTVPEGWGEMQLDPLKRNYLQVTSNRSVTVDLVGDNSADDISDLSRIVVVNIGSTFEKNDWIRFDYGAGTGSADNRGAEASSTIGVAMFKIEAARDSSHNFMPVEGVKPTAVEKNVTNKKLLGKVFTDDDDMANGYLRLDVIGAVDGSGDGTFEVVGSKAGETSYLDATGAAVTEYRLHAGDGDTAYIKFTYTADQTIKAGELKFIIPSTGGWTNPQNDSAVMPGYTRFDTSGNATLGEATYNTDGSVVVKITQINEEDTIEIHYGADGAGATVPTEVGDYSFVIQTKSTKAFQTVSTLAVPVYSQAKGGGTAMLTVTDSDSDTRASDTVDTIAIVYTAAGEIEGGQVKLTAPANWSEFTAENLQSSVGTPTLDKLTATISGVNLAAEGMITFTYTGAMAQPTKGTATFKVEVDGGAGPGTAEDNFGTVAVADGQTMSIEVDYARSGSGMASVQESSRVVTAGEEEKDLVFIYTATGEIAHSARDFRLEVDADWSPVIKDAEADDKLGTYEVSFLRGDVVYTGVVDRADPIDGKMVARINFGAESVKKGDMIIFTYQNATAPTTPEVSTFKMTFGGVQVKGDLNVIVQSAGGASVLIAEASPTMFSVDEEESVMITVKFQDAAENVAAMATATEVDLESTSSTGMFSDPKTGEAVTKVTVEAGRDSATVNYTDTAIGAATITATAGTLTDTVTVTGTTDVVTITKDSIMVSPALAKAGDMVEISVTGTSGKTATAVTVGGHANPSLPETPAGSGTYKGSFTVVEDSHPDGTYDVTVSLNGQSMTKTDALTIDTTDPVVTVTAPASGASAMNGDTITISATVTEAGTVSSVMANVKALDSTQTTVMLDMSADGMSYTKDVMISMNNENVNGDKTITVTAMDAAGNSGEGMATVELANMLKYTSMIPDGITLFHVPLDDNKFNTIADLRAALGDAVTSILVDDDAGGFDPDSDDVAITADLGIALVMNAAAEIKFEGNPWDGGDSTITLTPGANLIGLPLMIDGLTDISGIADLLGDAAAVVLGYVASVPQAAGPVAGDAGYYVVSTATEDVTVDVMGAGWTNGGGAGAAPIALSGYKVESQTPILSVYGSVVDEITGLTREGFRVKVKNLSTKASLSDITVSETESGGYSMAFVDVKTNHAARVGDVLEISADSPNPLIGVKPVRHIVTVDDVKNSHLQLEDLIAYEIPAETALLHNYPNPFNPETWIPYHLAEDADVTLRIYSINGELVRTIDVGHQTAAKYDTRSKAAYWDGRNRFGEQVASGVYFYNLDAGDFSATRKMVILK